MKVYNIECEGFNYIPQYEGINKKEVLKDFYINHPELTGEENIYINEVLK